MSQLNLDQNKGNYQIRGYRTGLIHINEQTYTTSLIIGPHDLIENWSPKTINELTPDMLISAAALKPDILLIGTGEKHALVSPSLYGELINQGIGVEVMSTGAACRTFNALISEDRNVVAALIIT